VCPTNSCGAAAFPNGHAGLQVEERTAGVKGRLTITLHGYKVLGVAGQLEDEVRKLGAFDPLHKTPVSDHESGDYRTLSDALQHDMPTSKIVPFDYVSTLDLLGKPDNIVDDEVPINVDGGYVTTVLGYSRDIADTSVQIGLADETEVDLKAVKLKDIEPVQTSLLRDTGNNLPRIKFFSDILSVYVHCTATWRGAPHHAISSHPFTLEFVSVHSFERRCR
jgi:hypothetical protein